MRMLRGPLASRLRAWRLSLKVVQVIVLSCTYWELVTGTTSYLSTTHEDIVSDPATLACKHDL